MRAVLLALCLAGCNQVFDLEQTIAIDADLADVDGDGVVDSTDNCPTLANADQANSDGDAFGDACDTCPVLASSSSHDEDRDHLGDDCDPCPGAPDFGVDTDGDGIGDLCDLQSAGVVANHRMAFDPFVAPSTAWFTDTVMWSQSADAIAPETALPAGDSGLRNTQITTAPGVWWATAGFESRTHWDEPDSFSIIAADASHRLECKVSCVFDAPSNALYCAASANLDGVEQVSNSFTPRPSLRLTMLVNTLGYPVCYFADDFTVTIQGVSNTSGMALSVTANPRIRVTFFDFVQ